MALDWPAYITGAMEADFFLEPTETSIQALLDPEEITVPRYQRWRAVFRIDNELHDLSHQIEGFLDSLVGGSLAVKVPNYKYIQQIGNASGTITLNGAHTGGDTSIDVSGMSGAFAVGDLIAIGASNPRLHRVTGTVAAGNIPIRPGLRRNIAGGTAVDYIPDSSVLSCTMRLVGGPGAAPMFPPSVIRSRTIEFVEVLNEATT